MDLNQLWSQGIPPSYTVIKDTFYFVEASVHHYNHTADYSCTIAALCSYLNLMTCIKKFYTDYPNELHSNLQERGM
jgi:hypothetical protein